MVKMRACNLISIALVSHQWLLNETGVTAQLMPDDDFYEDHEQLELEIDELIEEQALLEKWKDDIDRAHPNAGSDSGPTQKRTIAFREQS